MSSPAAWSYGQPPLQAASWPSGWTAEPTARSSGGGSLAAIIWTPALLVAVSLLIIDQKVGAIAVCGLSLLVHCMFRPRVSVYALLAILPADWMVSVVQGMASLSKILGAFALLLSLPRLFSGIVPTKWDKSGRWMIMLIGLAGLSIFWSTYPQYALIGWQSLALIWGIAALICLQLNDWESISTGMKVYIGGCVATGLVFLVKSDLVSAGSTNVRESFGTFVGEGGDDVSASLNAIARMFAVATFCCIMLFLKNPRWTPRLIYIGAAMVLVASIVLCKGRAVYVGLPFALLAGITMLGGAGVVKRVVLVGLIGIFGCGVTIVCVKLGLFGEGIVRRFDSIFEEGVEAGNRHVFWMNNLQLFVESAFMGVGVDQAKLVGGHVAHNDWVSIATEMGLLGVIFFFCFHASLFFRIRQMNDLWIKLFCQITWIFMLVVGLSQDDYVLKWYAMATGFLICLLNYDRRTGAAAVAGSPQPVPQLASFNRLTRPNVRNPGLHW